MASLIIWTLGYFPIEVDYSKDYDKEISTAQKELGEINQQDINDNNNIAGNTAKIKQEEINSLKLAKHREKQENSYIGRIGKFILPVMEPLGFDWKMSISIVTGLSAKEVVVGTMGVLYQSENGEESESSLVRKLREQEYHSGDKAGQKVFNPLIAMTFMLFILIYFPCVGVVAAIKKESGSWKWAIFSIVYTTSLAWIIAFAVKNIGEML